MVRSPSTSSTAPDAARSARRARNAITAAISSGSATYRPEIAAPDFIEDFAQDLDRGRADGAWTDGHRRRTAARALLGGPTPACRQVERCSARPVHRHARHPHLGRHGRHVDDGALAAAAMAAISPTRRTATSRSFLKMLSNVASSKPWCRAEGPDAGIVDEHVNLFVRRSAWRDAVRSSPSARSWRSPARKSALPPSARMVATTASPAPSSWSGDKHVGTPPGQRNCGGLANPARCPGDQRGPSSQIVGNHVRLLGNRVTGCRLPRRSVADDGGQKLGKLPPLRQRQVALAAENVQRERGRRPRSGAPGRGRCTSSTVPHTTTASISRSLPPGTRSSSVKPRRRKFL